MRNRSTSITADLADLQCASAGRSGPESLDEEMKSWFGAHPADLPTQNLSPALRRNVVGEGATSGGLCFGVANLRLARGHVESAHLASAIKSTPGPLEDFAACRHVNRLELLSCQSRLAPSRLPVGSRERTVATADCSFIGQFWWRQFVLALPKKWAARATKGGVAVGPLETTQG